jgi:hypothetical protein
MESYSTLPTRHWHSAETAQLAYLAYRVFLAHPVCPDSPAHQAAQDTQVLQADLAAEVGLIKMPLRILVPNNALKALTPFAGTGEAGPLA